MATITGTTAIKNNSQLTCTYGLTVSQGAQSIEKNETTIPFEYYVLFDTNGLYFSGTTRPNAGTVVVKINGSEVARRTVPLTNGIQDGTYIIGKTSGSVKVPHGNDGKKKLTYSIEILTGTDQNNYNYVWNASSKSGSFDLTDIPRSSKATITGDFLGEEITIAIARNSDSFTHSVAYSFEGSDYVEIGTGIVDSCKFTPSVELAQYIPNTTKGTLNVKVTTYNGSEKVGSETTSQTVLELPTSYIPTIESLVLTRIDNEVPSDWKTYVKGYSQCNAKINGAKGILGSTIKSFAIATDDHTSNESEYTTDILKKTGTKTFTATVTDSRDRKSNPVSVSIQVVDYYKPSLSLKADRCTADGTLKQNGTYLLITCPYDYAKVNNKNVATVRIECNGTYEETTSTQFVLDANCSASKTYVVSATIWDVITMEAEPITVKIPTDFRIIQIKKNKKGLALGKFAENDDEVDINLLIRARKGIVDENGEPFSGGGGDTLPIGSIVEWGSETIPTNWLLLNGQEVSREEYFELFELYGTRYGDGDGETTFNLPNRCGKVAVGLDSKDSDFDELGKTGGEKTHTLTVDEMPNHNHKHYQWVFHGGTATGGNHYGMSFQANTGILRARESYSTTGELQFGNEATGGGQAHNNLQPYVVVNFIVKAKQSQAVLKNGTIIDNLNSDDSTMALSARMGKILNEKINNVSGGGSSSSLSFEHDGNGNVTIIFS